MVKKWVKSVVVLSMLSIFTVASAGAETVSVGHLVDFTGPTGGVGAHYGPGVIDAQQSSSIPLTTPTKLTVP